MRRGPRVYISADMESVTGLVSTHDVHVGGQDYQQGRVRMTEDVNAAALVTHLGAACSH